MSAILMVAAMAATPGTAPAHVQTPPPPPDPAPMVHPVAPGESLSRIAQCELGEADRWVEIFELNRHLVTDPNLIVEGWELALPEPGTGDCPPVPLPSPAAAASSAATSASSGTSSSSATSSSSSGKSSSATSSSSKRTTATTAPREVAATSQTQSRAGGNLASIRQCESGGDYGAVSSSGKYRGAYQFDQQTWESVGGSGDPAAASAAEQDQRAAALHQQRGSQPWPNCG